MSASRIISGSISSPKSVGAEQHPHPNGAGIDAQAVEMDARMLARECLKEVGREMGVAR